MSLATLACHPQTDRVAPRYHTSHARPCWPEPALADTFSLLCPIGVPTGVSPSSLLLSQGGDEFAAEVGDVGDDAAPDQVGDGRETLKDVSKVPFGRARRASVSRLVWGRDSPGSPRAGEGRAAPPLATRHLPFFDSVYRVDQHEDVEQEAVPDPHDQHRLRQHEYRECAAEPEVASEHKP